MGIRINVPYEYKEYEHSELATRVDRFCHNPIRIACFFLIPALLSWYITSCVSVFTPKQAHQAVGIVCGVFVLVCFVGSLFLGIICDKCKLSERVARWDIAGRNYSGKMKLIIALLILVLILPGIIAGAVSLIGGMQQESYHNTMYVLAEPDSVPLEGDKAVSLVDGTFSKLYIPDTLQAEKPEEVRYILYCDDGEELAGVYGTSGVAGYRRCRTVEIVDRESGQTIATETFYGSLPSNTVSDGEGNQYGSEPDEESIRRWVAEVLQAD